mmetsp:Transcript_34146/g.133671  ORF Transcript_34146/g.133671 Transcript_34146/m.133671 type:complete len:399 (-) Transcript_34146:1503-2699(-)
MKFARSIVSSHGLRTSSKRFLGRNGVSSIPGEKVVLKNMSREELGTFLTSSGERKFRASQLWDWMYNPELLAGSFESMTNLPKALRSKLERTSVLDEISLASVHESRDGTKKLLFEPRQGGRIESVWIPSEDRTTLCVSSQLGCALNCQFCYTAKMGFLRNLTLSEILDQAILAKRHFDTDQRKISNIVFMGMGEPFKNMDHVIRACNILTSKGGLNMSHKKVTVSTSGVASQIPRFFRECRANLAVSLNATTDEVRNWIMPINRKYPLGVLMKALEDAASSGENKKLVTFEYVLLAGVNDADEDATRIARLIKKIPSKVNLIQFNPHDKSEFKPVPNERALQFQELLQELGVATTYRSSRGPDEMAACGQLGLLGQRPEPPRTRPPPEFTAKLQLVQ